MKCLGRRIYVGRSPFRRTGGFAPTLISAVYDYVLWYGKDKTSVKYRKLFKEKDSTLINAGYRWIETPSGERNTLKSSQLKGLEPVPEGQRLQSSILVSAGASEIGSHPYSFCGREFKPASGNHWKTSKDGLTRLRKANRLMAVKNTLAYVRYVSDFPVTEYNQRLVRYRAEYICGFQNLCCSDFREDHTTLYPDGHRRWRPRPRSHLRLRNHRVCIRAVGAAAGSPSTLPASL